MIKKLEYFLDNNHRILSLHQGKQIFLYLAFVLRAYRKFNIQYDGFFRPAGLLPELCKRVNKYEVKDAAAAFEQYMPWEFFRREPSLYHEINRIFGELYKNEKADEAWLRCCAEKILMLGAGEEGMVTPLNLCRLVAALVSEKTAKQIVDLCSGSFLLGLEVWSGMAGRESISCLGVELNSYFCALSRLMLYFGGVEDFSVKEGDVAGNMTLLSGQVSPKMIVADLPLVGNRTTPVSLKDEFLKDNKTTLYADWLVIYNTICHMSAGDCAFFVVTKGALVRENERFLRKMLVETDCVDAVISLPNGLYPNRGLPMALLVCEKGRKQERRGKILFADMSREALTEGKISQLANAFQLYSENENVRLIPHSAVVQNEYDLYPQIYFNDDDVLSGRLCIGDVADVIRGIQNAKGSPAQEGGERYLLNVRDIQHGEIDYTSADTIGIGNLNREEKFLVREDDIIVTARGAALKLAIVPPNPPPAYISGNLMIIRVNPEKYSPYVLYEYLMSEKGQTVLELIQTGTTIRVLGVQKTEELIIPEYEKQSAAITGESLKNAKIQYLRERKTLDLQYQAKKAELLEQLSKKENEHV